MPTAVRRGSAGWNPPSGYSAFIAISWTRFISAASAAGSALTGGVGCAEAEAAIAARSSEVKPSPARGEIGLVLRHPGSRLRHDRLDRTAHGHRVLRHG